MVQIFFSWNGHECRIDCSVEEARLILQLQPYTSPELLGGGNVIPIPAKRHYKKHRVVGSGSRPGMAAFWAARRAQKKAEAEKEVTELPKRGRPGTKRKPHKNFSLGLDKEETGLAEKLRNRAGQTDAEAEEE